jgi:hypothetical protein
VAEILEISITDHFEYYLMYRPAGDRPIWVPIAKVPWHWSGTATRPQGETDDWTLSAADWDRSPTVVKNVYIKQPEWNRIVGVGKDSYWKAE